VLQGVAVCCSVLQSVAGNSYYDARTHIDGDVCCSVLQCVAGCCRVCSELQGILIATRVTRLIVVCVAGCCSVLQCVAMCYSEFQGILITTRVTRLIVV